MPSWRKKLFALILLALLVMSIVFWGSLAGGCSILALILGIQAFLFNHYSSAELAKTFQEDGKNVEGWHN